MFNFVGIDYNTRSVAYAWVKDGKLRLHGMYELEKCQDFADKINEVKNVALAMKHVFGNTTFYFQEHPIHTKDPLTTIKMAQVSGALMTILGSVTQVANTTWKKEYGLGKKEYRGKQKERAKELAQELTGIEDLKKKHWDVYDAVLISIYAERNYTVSPIGVLIPNEPK
jgi:hypothetical protein